MALVSSMREQPRLEEDDGRGLSFYTSVAVVLVALSDATRRVGLQGELTLALLAFALLALVPALLRGPQRVPGRVLPPKGLILFLAWVGFGLVMDGVNVRGAQNVTIYLLFVTTIAVTASHVRPRTPKLLLRGYRASGLVLALVYLAAVALYGFSTNDGLYDARSLGGSTLPAIVAIIALTVYAGERSALTLTVIWAALVFSLSRTSIGVAAVLTMGLAFQGRSKAAAVVRVLALSGAVLLAVYLAYTYFEPFRNRFEQGDNYTVGNFTLGSSGRAVLWKYTWEHWLMSPWFGHGAGSAELYIESRLYPIAHPHNDWLRILHDFGLVGLLAWTSGMISIVGGCVRRLRRATDGDEKAVHFAACLGMLALCLTMIPDNPVTAVFVMVPIATLVGVSRGLGAGWPTAHRLKGGLQASGSTPGVVSGSQFVGVRGPGRQENGS